MDCDCECAEAIRAIHAVVKEMMAKMEQIRANEDYGSGV